MTIFDQFRLDGQVALVTGGARSLGYDMAETLLEAGASVAITSRDFNSADAAAARLRAATGGDVLPLALDVRDPAACQAAVDAVVQWHGRLDVLINNAGGTPAGPARPLIDRPPEAMADLIAINLLGTLYCCQAAARVMTARQSGVILNIASISGLIGRDRRIYQRNNMPEQPVDYAAAKGGVLALTRDLAAALGPQGIRVNALAPGGFARRMAVGFMHDYADRTPLGRMGRDGIDIKGAALFLVSPASAYVHGHTLVLDGGFSLWQ